MRIGPIRYGSGDNTFTYEDVLLTPAAEALKSVINPGVSVEFSLSGEQGLSIFSYPHNWSAAMARLKSRLSGYGSSQHTFGVCFNWDKVRMNVIT